LLGKYMRRRYIRERRQLANCGYFYDEEKGIRYKKRTELAAIEKAIQ
jgi:hypothetical protein